MKCWFSFLFSQPDSEGSGNHSYYVEARLIVNEMAADLCTCPDLSCNIATANRLPRCLQVKFNNGEKTKQNKKQERTSSPSCGEGARGWYLLVFVILPACRQHRASPCSCLPSSINPWLLRLWFSSASFTFCSLSFFSCPNRRTRASIGSRGRATWCPWTSQRWKSDRWEPFPAGGDDG